jgi:dTMP kinase
MQKKKGVFIVIDGTDGSGKGTQTERLKKKLRREGYNVRVADFPRYGEPSAAMVQDYLNGKFGSPMEVGPYRASILYAVDRYAASFQIRDWLELGCVVICNRYVSANMGHQAGKIRNRRERDKFLKWLEELEYSIFGIPKPDLNILLYLPPEMGQKLVDGKERRTYTRRKRDIHEADLKHLVQAAEAYRYVAKKYKWTTIDCTPRGKLLSREAVHSLIWKAVKPKLKAAR